MHPYKIQLTQELKPTDRGKRRLFAEWIFSQLDADFAIRIIFSDEAHFISQNKQNCRVWGTENPKNIQEKQMHPDRCTIWCGFWAGGVIGLYFIKDEKSCALTVNGERYRDMITSFL